MPNLQVNQPTLSRHSAETQEGPCKEGNYQPTQSDDVSEVPSHSDEEDDDEDRDILLLHDRLEDDCLRDAATS